MSSAGNDAPVALTPDADDPMVEQVVLRFAMNTSGARVEMELPAEGGDLDEKNILHVLGWYIMNGFNELLPVAIQSWHTLRREMRDEPRENKDAAVVAPRYRVLEDAASVAPRYRVLEDAAIVAPRYRVLGADGKPRG